MKLSQLTPPQIRELARAAKTSVDYLRHLAKGRRHASAEMAARIEQASAKLGVKVDRGSLCKACQECPYRRACAKK